MSTNDATTENGDTKPFVLDEPDLVVPPKPTPDPQMRHPTPLPSPQRRGGFAGGVIGGLIAAAVGYGLAQYVPQGWPIQDTSALQQALDAQQKLTADLQARIDAFPDTSALNQQIAAQDARLKAIETRPDAAASTKALTQMQSQIDALKSAPVAGIDPAAIQAVMAEAEAAAAKIKADAEATAAQASAKLALAEVKAALDSGAPFAASLAALGEVPAALTDSAQSGLPSLMSLTDSFPAAARAALDAALRADMGSSWTDRATNFLRTQTGARSTTPQEGSDPDAVLSRAEAALRSGDLTTALAEISTLPEPAQAELAAWRAMAEKRQAGIAAVAALSAAIGE